MGLVTVQGISIEKEKEKRKREREERERERERQREREREWCINEENLINSTYFSSEWVFLFLVSYHWLDVFYEVMIEKEFMI